MKIIRIIDVGLSKILQYMILSNQRLSKLNTAQLQNTAQPQAHLPQAMSAGS